MNSSDSDEDCYGNIAQRLQLIKNKYEKDKFIPNISVNDTTYASSCNKIEKNCSNAPAFVIDDENTPLYDSEEITIDSIIAKNSKKRITRSSSKLHQIDVSERPSRRNTKKKSSVPNADSKNEDAVVETIVTRSSRRSVGKQKQNEKSNTRTRRRKTRTIPEVDQNIPTYNIGNTDYYPDYSGKQQLFTTQKQNETIILEEDTIQSINEELSVKVIWQSSEYRKFTIRRYQKFTEIYDYYAQKENVSYDKLIFMYSDKIIKKDDTPETINYNIVKFIEGGITSENISCFTTKKNVNINNGLKIKFRYENVKKAFEVSVKADEGLSLAMIQCAEHFEVPLNKLKFIFDGDNLSGTSTPNDLELEGGECIDVKILN